MRILGLDASSSTIGYGFLNFDENWNLLEKKIGFIKPPKDGHIVDRLNSIRQSIYYLIDDLKPDRVVLEDILLQHPKTTIKTLAILAVVNRLVCLSIFDKLKIYPDLFAPMKIRHAIKLTQGRAVPKKEEVPKLMEHHLGNIYWIVQSKGKNKGSILKENADIADALACAYTLKVVSEKELKNKIKKVNKNAKRKSM